MAVTTEFTVWCDVETCKTFTQVGWARNATDARKKSFDESWHQERLANNATRDYCPRCWRNELEGRHALWPS